jgi:HK97 family phage portal protein
MGLWQRLTSAIGAARRKTTIEEWFEEFGTTLRSNSGVSVNQTTAMQSTVVMACVRIISQDIAKLPPHIYRVSAKGVRKEADGHPLYRIFKKPNSWQTWFEYVEQMQVALALRGNAYAAVPRDGRGAPTAMLPMNPDRVSLYEAPDGKVFYNFARFGLHETWEFRSFPQLIPADDVFHLRWAPGPNPLIGMSPIGYAREAIGYSLALEMHGANISGAGARPSGYLTTDRRLGEQSARRLAERWKSLHGGVANSGKTAVLEEGLKFEQLTMSSVDMEFIASRKLQVEEICRAMGVTPAKIGVLDQVGRNFEQIQLAHLTDTVDPNTRRWIDKLRVFFDLDDDLEVEFDIAQLLRADLAARTTAARITTMSGITRPNEARRSLHLDPDPDGDVLLVPSTMIPIGEAGKNTAVQPAALAPGQGSELGSDQSGAPAEGGDGDPAQLPEG